jgi:hypothetical protein
MAALVGSPSDGVPDVLATGRSGITSIFVSMSARHPDGHDADYLRWHCFDHRPEQYRLASIRSSVRLVSTPACRAARAACDARYEAVDHVMTYFFADVAGLAEFNDLAVALRGAGRIPYLLPVVERGVYRVDDTVAAPRIKVGADVLPWWPAEGGYVLLERGEARADDLLGIDGVAGAWSGRAARVDELYSTAAAGTQITLCFLDDDPLAVAERLGPALEARWASGIEPLFAAPFHVVLAHDLTRHLP